MILVFIPEYCGEYIYIQTLSRIFTAHFSLFSFWTTRNMEEMVNGFKIGTLMETYVGLFTSFNISCQEAWAKLQYLFCRCREVRDQKNHK